MKRIMVLLLICAAFVPVSADIIGQITYAEGSYDIIRGETVMTQDEISMGDSIETMDQVRTKSGGKLEITLYSSTNTPAIITVSEKTVFSMEIAARSSAQKSTLDLITGRIVVNVNKILGTSEFRVRTDTAVMGVRGTVFTVTATAQGDVLTICTQGKVECSEESSKFIAEPGNAVERRNDTALRSIPRVSNPGAFQDQWMTERIGVMKANLGKAISSLGQRYVDLYSVYSNAYSDLMAQKTLLQKWYQEDRQGKTGSRIDVMREKKVLLPILMRMRKAAFILERVYYRLDEMVDYFKAQPLDGRLPSGITYAEFVRRFENDRVNLFIKFNAYRNVVRLYALRNEGMIPFGDDPFADESDFFGDTDSFFD